MSVDGEYRGGGPDISLLWKDIMDAELLIVGFWLLNVDVRGRVKGASCEVLLILQKFHS